MEQPIIPERIVILTLDSFASYSGLVSLIENLEGRIVLLCLSNRFGGKYGSFFTQVRNAFRHSGIQFVWYQTFNLIVYRIISVFHYRSLIRVAKRHGISVLWVENVNDNSIIAILKEKKPDVILSFYFDQLIKKRVIQIPSFGVINVHTASLPKCRGPFPVLCTLRYGMRGCVSVHAIEDEQLDAGPIYVQEVYDIDHLKSVLSLDRDAMVRAAKVVTDLFRDMSTGNYQKYPQESGESYMSFPVREDIQILKERGIPLFRIREFLNL